MKKLDSKLRLQKETVAALDRTPALSAGLERVLGGLTPSWEESICTCHVTL